MHYKERVMNHHVIVRESTGKVMNIIEILSLSMSNLKFSASTADLFCLSANQKNILSSDMPQYQKLII